MSTTTTTKLKQLFGTKKIAAFEYDALNPIEYELDNSHSIDFFANPKYSSSAYARYFKSYVDKYNAGNRALTAPANTIQVKYHAECWTNLMSARLSVYSSAPLLIFMRTTRSPGEQNPYITIVGDAKVCLALARKMDAVHDDDIYSAEQFQTFSSADAASKFLARYMADITNNGVILNPKTDR